MRFEWDEKKAKANFRKHRVRFEEAQTVFKDDSAKIFVDEMHSDDEDRFDIIGRSASSRYLFVCHCYRREDVIRIISARKADAARCAFILRSRVCVTRLIYRIYRDGGKFPILSWKY